MAKKPVKYVRIKSDLMDQMERNQTYGEHFEDLLNDYMSLYEIKNMLIKKGIKKNDSIEQLLKANTQMLKILDALGIKAVQETDGEFDDEEL